MKIAINKCFGGWGLSQAAYAELGIPWDTYGFAFSAENERTDPKLIACIEKLGAEKASGSFAKIKIVEVPDGISWEISDYDGIETVKESHSSWS